MLNGPDLACSACMQCLIIEVAALVLLQLCEAWSLILQGLCNSLLAGDRACHFQLCCRGLQLLLPHCGGHCSRHVQYAYLQLLLPSCLKLGGRAGLHVSRLTFTFACRCSLAEVVQGSMHSQAFTKRAPPAPCRHLCRHQRGLQGLLLLHGRRPAQVRQLPRRPALQL